MANNGADIFDVMTKILEDFDSDEMLVNSRERLSSSGSYTETSGPVQNDSDIRRTKSVKDKWKGSRAKTSK